MQIMPDTGQWIAQQLNYQNFDLELLFSPELNIHFGSWYLADLIKQYQTPILVLAAYNAGRGNVKKWLEERKGELNSSEDFPFKETRNYVEQVLKIYDYYQRLYDLE